MPAASAEPAKPPPQQMPADEPAKAATDGQPAEATTITTELAKAVSAQPVPAGQAEAASTESAQAEPGKVAEPAKAEPPAEPPVTPSAPAAPAAAPPPGVRLKRPELSRLALELRVAQAKLDAARTMLDHLCRLGPAEVDEKEYAGDAIAQMLVSDELDEIKRVCGGLEQEHAQARGSGK
ncbi:MAG TPA: hypothetical protein VFZ16_02310 [Hyphomicrobiaceae bacterium]|nr:hypothetical protein [Hyphomicrobiaceae bacterium]